MAHTQCSESDYQSDQIFYEVDQEFGTNQINDMRNEMTLLRYRFTSDTSSNTLGGSVMPEMWETVEHRHYAGRLEAALHLACVVDAHAFEGEDLLQGDGVVFT